MSEMSDLRPHNCRFRLQDEGKPYPRSSCTSCGKNIVIGLGKQCTVAETSAATALTERDKEIEALRANQERMWCTHCGTVTRDDECDCTIHGTCGDPNFVNYADAMQKEYYVATQKAIAAEARAETAERVFEDILDELGCERNNEAALQAIAVLKARVTALRNRTETAERERDEARAALKPMAEVAKDIPDDWDDDHQCVTACGHFRRAARAVIEQGE